MKFTKIFFLYAVAILFLHSAQSYTGPIFSKETSAAKLISADYEVVIDDSLSNNETNQTKLLINHAIKQKFLNDKDQNTLKIALKYIRRHPAPFSLNSKIIRNESLETIIEMHPILFGKITLKNINSACKKWDNNTPLHSAANDFDPIQTQLLIDHGADPNALNAKGETPLDMTLPYIRCAGFPLDCQKKAHECGAILQPITTIKTLSIKINPNPDYEKLQAEHADFLNELQAEYEDCLKE